MSTARPRIARDLEGERGRGSQGEGEGEGEEKGDKVSVRERIRKIRLEWG